MKQTEKNAALITGIGLFVVAALFSIGILLGFLDYGATTYNDGNILSQLGSMLISVYGFCSILIPAFSGFPPAFRPETPPKGEFVLIVAGAPEEKQEIPSETDAAARVAQLMTEGVSRKDAVKQTAKELGLSKNAVYDIALKDAEEINS